MTWGEPAQKRGFEIPIERCPFCAAVGAFKVRGRIEEIPYFGEVMETLATCDSCKFKHADVACLGERDPARYEYEIKSEEDLMVRVVRSSTGTIKLPEIGVTIDPGPASEGYVSNVEGVLDRVEEVLRLAMRTADPVRRRRLEARMKKLSDVRSGRSKATLIVIDPFGYSAIVSERAKARKLKRRSEPLWRQLKSINLMGDQKRDANVT